MSPVSERHAVRKNKKITGEPTDSPTRQAPSWFLSGRYIINYHVPNPLTCRHKHACACHGEPPAPARPKRPAQQEYEKQKENLCWQLGQICAFLALELEPHSEARQALDRAVAEFKERYRDVPAEAQ